MALIIRGPGSGDGLCEPDRLSHPLLRLGPDPEALAVKAYFRGPHHLVPLNL